MAGMPDSQNSQAATPQGNAERIYQRLTSFAFVLSSSVIAIWNLTALELKPHSHRLNSSCHSILFQPQGLLICDVAISALHRRSFPSKRPLGGFGFWCLGISDLGSTLSFCPSRTVRLAGLRNLLSLFSNRVTGRQTLCCCSF